MLHETPRALIGRVWGVVLPPMSLAALLSALVAAYLHSTLLRRFHATLSGLSIGPIDPIFTVSGLLSLAGGLFAMRQLRRVRLAGDAVCARPAIDKAAYTGDELSVGRPASRSSVQQPTSMRSDGVTYMRPGEGALGNVETMPGTPRIIVVVAAGEIGRPLATTCGKPLAPSPVRVPACLERDRTWEGPIRERHDDDRCERLGMTRPPRRR